MASTLPSAAQTFNPDNETRVSRPGVYAGYTSQRYDGHVEGSFYVPVRDGTRLAVTIYRPTSGSAVSNERLPVLFSFTPYLARRIDAGSKAVSDAEKSLRGNRPFVELTRYGYVVAVADVRGKGSSFGKRAAYADRMEGEDGADLVEWLATQPWSDGKVGMFGCSYVAGTQWATARNLPSHLRAIFPQAGQFDSYRNVRRGGIAGQINTRPVPMSEDLPTASVDADTDGSLRNQALKQHEANGQMLDLVRSLPFRDDRTAEDIQYWSLSSPYPKAAQIAAAGIAVYNWANWRDELADQSLIAYENLRDGKAMSKLLVTSGMHCDTDSIDSFAEHLRFFDHTLKVIDNGIDREPPIAFRTQGLLGQTNLKFASSLPLSNRPPRRFFLGPQGSLIGRRPAASKDQYQVTYDVGCAAPGAPSTATPNRVNGIDLPPPSAWACVNPKAAHGYVTAPMPQDSWLSDFGVVELKLATTATDAYVFGYLEDVAPDGTASFISHGRLLASSRKQGAPLYRNLGLPWFSGLREDSSPVQPEQQVSLRFELSPTSFVVRKGHQLRFSIAGADIRQRELAKIAVLPAPVWTIGLGGDDPSYVDLALSPLSDLLAKQEAGAR